MEKGAVKRIKLVFELKAMDTKQNIFKNGTVGCCFFFYFSVVANADNIDY